jgi:hypothetical protein
MMNLLPLSFAMLATHALDVGSRLKNEPVFCAAARGADRQALVGAVDVAADVLDVADALPQAAENSFDVNLALDLVNGANLITTIVHTLDAHSTPGVELCDETMQSAVAGAVSKARDLQKYVRQRIEGIIAAAAAASNGSRRGKSGTVDVGAVAQETERLAAKPGSIRMQVAAAPKKPGAAPARPRTRKR